MRNESKLERGGGDEGGGEGAASHGDTLNENDYDIIELNFDIVMHHAYAKLLVAAAAFT